MYSVTQKGNGVSIMEWGYFWGNGTFVPFIVKLASSQVYLRLINTLVIQHTNSTISGARFQIHKAKIIN